MSRDKHERNRPAGGRLEDVSGALLVRRFSVRQPQLYRVIEKVVAQKLSFLSMEALCELSQTLMDLEYNAPDGDILQVGCRSAGEAIVIAHAKKKSRNFWIHDTGTQKADELEKIKNDLALFNVDERVNTHIVSGEYPNTLDREDAVLLACLDSKDYQNTLLFLEKVTARLVSGGYILISGYKNREHCQKAVDEFFHARSGFKLITKSRMNIVKI